MDLGLCEGVQLAVSLAAAAPGLSFSHFLHGYDEFFIVDHPETLAFDHQTPQLLVYEGGVRAHADLDAVPLDVHVELGEGLAWLEGLGKLFLVFGQSPRWRTAGLA